jgi:MFS transporter, ACS family, glucarate transporter
MNLSSKVRVGAAELSSVRTSVRYRVLWLCVLLYAITYMDRVCIYAAMPVIAREFSFDKLTQGLIFSAFAWGYSTLQVPSGWLVDRVGPRRMLSSIVLWWSAFTMLTVSAWNTASFVVIRFLFGAGEAGAFPSATRAFSRWLATSERGFAQGVTHSGSRLAGALTHGVVAGLIVLWGWRMPFLLFGVIGILWAVFWFFWYRDRPEDHQGVSASELEWINEGKSVGKPKKSVLSWRKLLGRPNMWYVCIMYFCYGYVLWIFLSWLPTYFAEVRGFGLVKSGIYTMIPLLAGAVTNSLGGWFSDRLYVRTGNLCYSRRLVAITGFGIAVVFVTLGVLASHPTLAVLAMSLAVGGLELTTGVSWAVPLDIGHDHSGTVSGVMNMFGNWGGALSPLLVAWLVQQFNSWTPAFILASFLCLVAGLLWFKIDPTISVVEEVGDSLPARTS